MTLNWENDRKAFERHVRVLGRARGDATVRIYSETFQNNYELSLAVPMPADTRGWARRAEGIIRTVLKGVERPRGLEIWIDADLPVGGGLSSSAASMAAFGMLAARVNGIELDVVHGRREPRNVPIYIGATGGKMIEMTGRIADGIVMNYCVPVEYNDYALEQLDKGLRQSGRKMEDFDRPQLVVCSVDEDHDKAIDTTRELLTQYLAQQPHIAQASGVSMDVVESIQAILGWPATHEQIQAAKHLVPEDLIHRITASGTPDEARAKVQEYIDHGCTTPILYGVGGNTKLLIDTFTTEV